jgi:hypothetical protein
VNQTSKALPAPTPEDIEAALDTMRNGTSPYGRWMRLEDSLEYVLFRHDGGVLSHALSHKSFENDRKANAEADRLWWVTIIEPDGEELVGLGGGTTLAEAAAVAWINSCIGISWKDSGLSDQEDANVPRHVPEVWQFELHKRPVRPVLTIIEGSRPSGSDNGRVRLRR